MTKTATVTAHEVKKLKRVYLAATRECARLEKIIDRVETRVSRIADMVYNRVVKGQDIARQLDQLRIDGRTLQAARKAEKHALRGENLAYWQWSRMRDELLKLEQKAHKSS